MSIIEEALRRAEHAPSPSVPAPSRTATSPSPLPSPTRSRAGTYLIVGLALAILVGSWAIRHTGAPQRSALTPRAVSPMTPHTILPPTGMETMAALEDAPVFRLSGIVTQPGAPVAVINDRIVRMGDVIDGATVVTIAPNEVVLERSDQRVTLTLSR